MVGCSRQRGCCNPRSRRNSSPATTTRKCWSISNSRQASTSSQTDEGVRHIVDLIDDKEPFPEVEGFAAYVGFGGPRFVLSLSPVDPAPNKGFIVVNTNDLAGAEAIVPRLREIFAEQVPDINARVTRMFLGPEDPKVIRLAGHRT